jgi:hypothetical protein
MLSPFVSFVDVALCTTKEKGRKQLISWRLGIILKFDAIAVYEEGT